MEQQHKKIGIFKCGNIGTSPLLELLLDELADRKDIKVRTVTTGSKMGADDVEEALPKIFEFNPDLLILTSPNTALPGPAKVREKLSSSGLPGLVITDAPGKRIKAELEKQGLGYIIITGDPLIGARKEFLDPTEMAIFNSNISKVLAITGVYRIVHQEIDKVIYAHEVAQIAARLAEEAREIEKYNDTLTRKPHAKDGKPKTKTKLMLPPTLDGESS